MTTAETVRNAPLVGILALQGDVREHARAVEACGGRAVTVRRPAELAEVDGLILPGGESTTIDKLSRIFGMAEPLKDRIRAGFPVYGSCAGMILLADEIADPACDQDGRPQQTFGGLDMTVRRNAFGRQRESFETDLDFDQLAGGNGAGGESVHAVFIRAPWAERLGAGVLSLADVRIDGKTRAVAVRTEHLLATSFHPEVTGELRVHELFIRMIRKEA
ncbi:MAG TPA: pyridoxal 5'-phosphate synthase glutaminase subunit PdxT [Micrococcaceae bacterium]